MEASYGSCAYISVDKFRGNLFIKNGLDKTFVAEQLRFDPTEKAPQVRNPSDEIYQRYSFLNEYSYSLLEMLKWPEEVLLFFVTDQEATKILRVLFPNPELVESEGMIIRVHIMQFNGIDLEFLSSLNGFRSFPAKPLKVLNK